MSYGNDTQIEDMDYQQLLEQQHIDEQNAAQQQWEYEEYLKSLLADGKHLEFALRLAIDKIESIEFVNSGMYPVDYLRKLLLDLTNKNSEDGI